MRYVKKYVSITNEEFDQLMTYILQTNESIEELKNKKSKNLPHEDILNATAIHSKYLKNYSEKLYEKYKSKSLSTLENMLK